MTDNDSTPAPELETAAAPTGFEMRGTAISPGLAIGAAHRKDYELERANPRRVPLDQVEQELNRFHASLSASKEQLGRLKEQLRGRVPAEHIRILDTHVAYLRDSVFLSDVENLILNEQMSLEAAIAKVIADFDRIFRLVENETLRERAVDLRDVGIRVLRNLDGDDDGRAAVEETSRPENYLLVARELSIVDMFHLDGKEVLGIATEEGGLTSHAAILARSMGVPMVTGLEGLRERVQEGDVVILDATEGVLRINPDDVVRAQYREASAALATDADAGAWTAEDFHTGDGTPIRIRASCGNLPEVEQAYKAGLSGVGLYRTELLYLIDRAQPSLDSLVAHYSAVLEEAQGRSVTFRLLDVDSSFGLGYLHDAREPNPVLGRAGVRVLIEHDAVLRRQLQAILRAAVEGTRVRIAVPFVNDVAELRRVKETLFDARSELQSSGLRLTDELELGAVIETPAAALGAGALFAEVDFAVLSYDALAQFLLASDRENHDLTAVFRTAHPVVLRCVQGVVEAARAADLPLSVFGPAALQPSVLPLLVAAGVRELCAPTVVLKDLDRTLAAIDLKTAEKALPKVLAASCAAETLPIVDAFLRAYDELEGVSAG